MPIHIPLNNRAKEAGEKDGDAPDSGDAVPEPTASVSSRFTHFVSGFGEC